MNDPMLSAPETAGEIPQRSEKGLQELVKERTRELEAARDEALEVKSRLDLAQFVVDHATDEIYWMRPDGSFAYVNQSACSTLGYTGEELRKLSVCDIDPDFQVGRWSRHWRELKEKGRVLLETRHRTREGRVFPVEIHASYLKFGDQEYNCAIAHDITSRKKAEEDLQETVKELKRWQSAMLGREGRTLELKREVNELLTRLGEEPRYGIL